MILDMVSNHERTPATDGLVKFSIVSLTISKVMLGKGKHNTYPYVLLRVAEDILGYV
jgi:hypothetical protein